MIVARAGARSQHVESVHKDALRRMPQALTPLSTADPTPTVHHLYTNADKSESVQASPT
jgi:hypothetical protein